MSEKKIRVATKKMMAYPKDEQYEDNYELHRCLHCKEEYLSQGILDEEVEFCPLHIIMRIALSVKKRQRSPK